MYELRRAVSSLAHWRFQYPTSYFDGRLDLTRRGVSSRLDLLHPQVGVHATHSSRPPGRVARAARLARRRRSRPRTASSSAIRIPFEKYTLPNGLTVVLSEDHATPTVAVEVIYHVGSKNEIAGHTGFAHMFEHVMFTGSGHVPYGTARQVHRGRRRREQRPDVLRLDALLGDRSVELSRDRALARVGSHGLSARLARRRRSSSAQRDIVKNERRQSYDNQPYGRDGEIIGLALYPHGHPHSWPTIGSMADLVGRVGGRRQAILPPVLRAEQRDARHRRRLRSGADQGVDREVLRRHSARQADHATQGRTGTRCRAKSG